MSSEHQKVLLTGANGYIGSNLSTALIENGYTVIPSVMASTGLPGEVVLDITNTSETKKIISKVKPDIIIHTAGLSSLAKCEEDPELARRINFEGTKNLVEVAGKAKFIFFSSDYVFSGDKGDYLETDTPDPVTVYGQTKLEAEKYIQNNLKDYIILRTANIFGRGGNFFSFVIECLNEKKEVEVFSDVYFTPTYIDYLIDSIIRLATDDYTGIIHIVGRERVSRYEFALKIAEAVGTNKKLIKKAKSPADSLIAKDSSLNSGKALSLLKNLNPSIAKAINYHLSRIVYPYFFFGDSRGEILGITHSYQWEEINYVESEKSMVRGNHYHKKTTEGFFIIDGKIRVTLSPVESPGKKEEFYVEKGDIFQIHPLTLHTFETIMASKWINYLSEKIDPQNKDIYRI